MYLDLIVDASSGQTDKLFTYEYREEAEIAIGDRVVVPFGKGEKPTPALVYAIREQAPDFKCKEVVGLLPKKYSFTKTQMYQIHLLRVYYAGTYRAAYRLILPSSQDLVIIKKYLIKKNDFLQTKLGDIFSERELTKLLSKKQRQEALRRGEIEELIEYDIKVSRERAEEVLPLFGSLEEALQKIRPNAIKQRRILKYLENVQAAEYRMLLSACACSRSDVIALAEKGLLELQSYEKEIDVGKYFNREKKKMGSSPLSDEQERCFKVFKEHKQNHRNDRFPFRSIVNGVTGSGKTRLYFEMAKEVLKEGKQVLFLLPEIALSLQVLSSIYANLTQDLAVIHTHVSEKDKAAYYQEIKSGRAKVILGVRSALFAPFHNLGMIVIDESHERTYQSDQSPRFDAIRIAMEMSERFCCDLVLGSATSTLELIVEAKKRNYYFLKMEKRIGGTALPEFFLIDMKSSERRSPQISAILYEKLKETFEKGEQAMILHNRRGYSSYRQCSHCMHIESCINCDIAMSVSNKRGDLYCKYCDYKKTGYEICSRCHQRVRDVQLAVKSLEEELRELFPESVFVSLDGDSTRASKTYLKTIADFEEGKIDAILGTQVIAKGFDFDKVSTAAIVNADQIFHSPDYSSAETAFNLMYQLAGRAGRRKKRGRVYIQCVDTEHRTLKHLLKNDFSGFLKEENELRRLSVFPPYAKFVNIKIVSEFDSLAKEQAERIAYLLQALRQKNRLSINVYDYKRHYHHRIRNRYIYTVLIKNIGEDEKKISRLLYQLCVADKYGILIKKVAISLDFDPRVL